MKLLELTLKSGKKITFIVGATFSIYEGEGNGEGCRIQDGGHNNGGWPIRESYKEVLKKLKEL